MIRIEKAILHILDFRSGVTVCSDAPLSVEGSIGEFLEQHIGKAWASQAAKPGVFYEESLFRKWLEAYRSGELDFVALSKEIAKTLEAALTRADEMASCDLLVLDAEIEGSRQLVVFKCTNHPGFVHQVQQGKDGVQNEIINHYAILPGPSQRMEEFAFADLAALTLRVSAKAYTLDGERTAVFPEILLEAALSPSPQEAMKSLSKTAQKVAEAYGADSVKAESAVKSYVAAHMEEGDTLDLTDAGREIFKEHPAMQEDFSAAVRDAGFEAPVRMDPEAARKKAARHKLKTDTGIELVIPTDYMASTEYVEFQNNEDGTLSITLKQITRIENKG